VRVDGGWLYTVIGSRIERVPTSGGGSAQTVANTPGRAISDYAIRGCTLYLALEQPTEVLAVPLP
jgi:hypothetical protein